MTKGEQFLLQPSLALLVKKQNKKKMHFNMAFSILTP